MNFKIGIRIDDGDILTEEVDYKIHFAHPDRTDTWIVEFLGGPPAAGGKLNVLVFHRRQCVMEFSPLVFDGAHKKVWLSGLELGPFSEKELSFEF